MVGIGNNNFPANILVLDGLNWENLSIQMWVIFNIQDVSECVAEGLQPVVENATYAQKVAYKEADDFSASVLIMSQ